MESDDDILFEIDIEKFIPKSQRVDNSDDTSEEIGSPLDYFNVQLEE